MFSNPSIRSIYRKNPQPVRFLRPNPSIRNSIHPPLQKIIVFEPQQTSRLLFVYLTLVSPFLITRTRVTFYTTIHLCHVISTLTSAPLKWWKRACGHWMRTTSIHKIYQLDFLVISRLYFYTVAQLQASIIRCQSITDPGLPITASSDPFSKFSLVCCVV